MTQQSPAGWYPDHTNPALLRYWDGQQWTAHYWPPPSPIAPPYSAVPVAAGVARSSNGGARTAILVATGILVAVVLGILALGLGLGYATGALPSADDDAPERRTTTTVALGDRPAMVELLARTNDMRESYTAMGVDGSIHGLVPRTQGSNYLDEFLAALRSLESRISFFAVDVVGTDIETLDARIFALDAEVTALENRFLAGEDFNSEDVSLADLSNDELAHLVASFIPERVDGTYWQAVEDLAALWDMEIAWVDGEDGSALCYWSSDDEDFDVQGYYCEAEPHIIYINTASAIFQEDIRSLDVVMTTRHEMGHAAINRICGTTEPAIIGTVHVEAVTNSYTVLYLGGDWDILGWGAADEYIISPESDRIARAIHAGTCR